MKLLVGKVKDALLFMTGLVIVVSGISIFVSIYNSMSDRKKEIAIMRALGAQRRTVFAIILTESILLCFGGGIIGGLCGHAMIFAAAPYVEASTGMLMNPWAFHPAEFWLLPGMVLLASLVGFIPGMTAYRTDVARTLAD
jgi:putative ABC transport system permease protein